MPEAANESPMAGLSIGAARRSLLPALKSAGIAEPEREARLLVGLATGLTPERLLAEDARALTAGEARALEDALARRRADEPLSRIRGERHFYGRPFTVTPAVLDPRPETETLVDQVLAGAEERGGRGRPLRILDVGTGSGCLLVTLLAELPVATGLGTDVSADALDVARANAARNDVAERARFAVHRSLEGVEGPFDILVANPPYIPTGDIGALEAGVRAFDPRGALDGGPDGLAIYREIAARAGAVVPSGWIVLEVGAGQAEALAGMFREALGDRVERVVVRPDLGGHLRCVALLTHS